MTLDLVIRGTGSRRSPDEHLAAVMPEYPGSQVVLYGQAAALPTAVRCEAEPGALAEAVLALGETPALVYADESLLAGGAVFQPAVVWVALGSDANGVREIWRIRQQHGWLTGRKLGLLVEHLDGTAEPDLERMMRLSRAVKAVLVPSVTEIAGQVASTAVVEAETAVTSEPQAVAVAEPLDAEPEAEPETAPVAEAAAAESAEAPPAVAEEPPAVAEEPLAEAPEPVADQPASEPALSAPAETQLQEGADTPMLENTIDHAHDASAPAAPSAEQALIQRYTLVKERRSIATRTAEVEATLQHLLKEIFVARFAAGPEAAAAFEELTRKLADTSAEFTKLTKTSARIEAGLAQLNWLKDELEI